MPKKARLSFGESSRVESALSLGTINQRDVLFLDEKTVPKIGWVDLDGNPVIVDTESIIVVESLPEVGKIGKLYVFGNDGYIWNGTEFVNMCKPTDLTELEAAVSKKADAEVVNAELDTINADVEELVEDVKACENIHEKIKYEITGVPVGTIVDIRDEEIRIFCPADTVFTKQTVGTGGDPNCYYATLNTYVYDEDVVGYKEHLGTQSDAEILTDLKTDKYGRRFQQTWLALASYDESTSTWNYYGKNSTSEKYIGWDYRLDKFNADGVMIASDSIRINLSNEECHNDIEPYYVGKIMKTVDEKIQEKMAEMESAIEIVEF